MKGKKAIFVLTAGILSVLALSGCNKNNKKPDGGETPAVVEITGISFSAAAYSVAPGQSVQLEATVAGTGDFNKAVKYSLPANAEGFTLSDSGLLSASKDAAGKTIAVTATAVGKESVSASVNVTVFEFAEGYQDFSQKRGIERADMLGALEKYAVNKKLTGIPFMGNAGYVMYADGVVKGTNTYIPGYGFGILSEGRIDQDLAGEETPEYRRYYHTYDSTDPKKLNMMDDKGSVVSGLNGYVTASYWDTQMNEDKDGYIWVGDLAKQNRPTAIEPDEDGASTTFRFEVKVGSELKYKTNTTVERLAAFNDREVTLEDYITPYKIYFTAAYGLKRSSENLKYASSISGAEAYYKASAAGFNATAWENVGIKGEMVDGKAYLQFTFRGKCTPFFAMYYLASGMFAPVPEEFVLACGGAGNTDLKAGVKAWGVSSSDGTENPGDHWLSTGPYVVDKWNKDQNIIFVKNTNYADRGRYQIAGIHENILAAAGSDPNAAFKQFLAGHLTSAGIPSDYLAEYRTDPRATMTKNSSIFKLNVNTCDAEMWEALFGVNGSVTQTAKSDYWEVEPAMNIPEFIDGINYSINRREFAEKVGRGVGYEYLAENYLIDPENGVYYNETQQHKDAIKDFVEGTDGTGYSLELAKAAFRTAADKLIANGDYEEGQTIKVEIAWMEESDETDYGGPIKQYIEKAFNESGAALNLEIELWHGAQWDDVYYNKMMVGQFDIGFGSISGNSYDPLNFFEVLKSDNSSGMTLNWGVDTNEVDGSIVYDGKVWSFDGLWEAADHGAIVSGGAIVPFVEVTSIDVQRLENGDLVVYLGAIEREFDEKNYGFVFGICLFACSDNTYEDYYEVYVTVSDESGWAYDETTGVYSFTFAAALVEQWLAAYPNPYVQGIDVYYAFSLNGSNLAAAFLGTYWYGAIPEVPAP